MDNIFNIEEARQNKLLKNVEYIEAPPEYRDLRKNKRTLLKRIEQDIKFFEDWRAHIKNLNHKRDCAEIFLDLLDNYIE